MRNLKEWFSANELIEIDGLPNSPQGINKKARTQNWKKRNRDGVQGGAVEYHYSSFPEDVQRALGFSIAFPTTPHSRDDFVINTPSGAEYGFELKAKRYSGKADTGELMHAVRVIEQALAQIGKTPPPTQNDGLNNIERHLVNCFRKASEEGRVAILNIAETMAALQEKKEESELLETHQVA